MTTQLTLYSGALRNIKHRQLSALTDDVEERYLLDNVYADTKNLCLSMGNWNFAGRTAAIEAATDVESEFGYSYAVEKPSDWVRTVQVSGNGDFYPQAQAGEYVDEGDYWNCNVDPLYVRYVSNHANYGGDLARWPIAFVRYVEWELAILIAPHLTAMSAGELDALEDKRQRALRVARSIDASNQAPDRKPVGRLVLARTGGRSNMGPRRQW
jgi:hypothetical protein